MADAKQVQTIYGHIYGNDRLHAKECRYMHGITPQQKGANMRSIPLLMLFFVFSAVAQTFAFTEEEKLEKLALVKQLKSKGETVYAIVPKNVHEPFMDETGRGCVETAKKMGLHCIYYGSREENMFLQESDILALIEAGIDGIAISGIKQGWLSERNGEKFKRWGKPIVAYDSPLSREIAQAYIGTDNYLMGRTLGTEVRKLKPDGGTFCMISERPDSPNHTDRLKGIMDAITRDGQDQDKWKNTDGCPMYNYGSIERSAQQVARLLETHYFDVILVTGGGPQFIPAKYRKMMEPFKNDIKTGKLIFANIDTIPTQVEYLKEGIATVNVGQRPYEMGKWSARILKMITDGEIPPAVVSTAMTICTRQNADTCTQ
jgi:ribose transport system substrate-binding protein